MSEFYGESLFRCKLVCPICMFFTLIRILNKFFTKLRTNVTRINRHFSSISVIFYNLYCIL